MVMRVNFRQNGAFGIDPNRRIWFFGNQFVENPNTMPTRISRIPSNHTPDSAILEMETASNGKFSENIPEMSQDCWIVLAQLRKSNHGVKGL